MHTDFPLCRKYFLAPADLKNTFSATIAAAALLAAAGSAQANGSWTTEVSLPVPTQEVSVTALSGLVYVAAGSLNQARTNAVWVFDPATHAWTSLAPYPGPARDHVGIAGVGGFLYLIGGVTEWPQPSVDTIDRYDPSTNAWTTVAPLPIARGATGVAVLNGKIYVAGGLEAGTSVADFAVYDPSTNTWTSLPPMPTARDHLTAAALNGKIYAIGGRINGQTCSPMSVVEIFDPATNTWSAGTPMLTGHAGHAIGSVNGRIQIFGGEGNAGNCGTIAASEEFDPVANAWTALPNMPTPRHGTGGATINSSVYIPGGGVWTGDAATEVHERFDENGTDASGPPPAPWSNLDVGSVGLQGSTFFSNGVFTVRGEGADIWGSEDAFQYVYQPMSGDGQIVARVDALGYTNPYAKAGVMIREDLTAGARHVILDTRPSGALELMTRTAASGSTTFVASASQVSPTWLRLTRAGSTFTAATSSDGVTWTTVGTTSVPLPSSVLAGLAVVSHDAGALTSATFDSVAVTGAASGTPPTVTLTSPADHATFTAPATIDLAATASDADGSVARVDFLANGTLVGTATTSPYTAAWSNVAAGSYAVTAVATDNSGLQTTSAPASITVSQSSGGLPPPWADQDIGAVGATGSAAVAGSVFTVRGSGDDIWGTTDAFNYAYQPLSGDGSIVARVTAVQNTNTFAKAGVMLRETLTSGSSHVVLDLRPTGDIELMTRSAAGASTTFIAAGTGSPPAWLKLTRTGSTVAAFVSADGVSFTQIGSITVTFGANAFVGLAVTSHSAGVLNTSTFDNVTVTAGTTPQPPGTPSSPVPSNNATGVSTTPTLTWTSSGATSYDVSVGTVNPPPVVSTAQSAASYAPAPLAAGIQYFWQITAHNSAGEAAGPVWSFTTAAAGGGGLPPPWTDQDIGDVGAAGSAAANAGVFTVKGAGGDIWGAADAFNYVYQPLSGDGTIVARVTAVQNTNTFAKAGVMLRETLTPGSSHVLLDVRPTGDVEFMTRSSTGGSTSFIAGATQPAPTWLKLARAGSTITASVSADGATFTQVGSTSVAIGANAFIGLAVTSHSAGVLNTSTFDSVTVTAGTTPQPPGTPASPAPANNATGVSPTPTLTWTSAGATSYDVRFGTVNPPPAVATGQTAASYTPAPLAAGTTYFWQITAHNSVGATVGPVWTFTTAASGGGGLPPPWTDQDIGAVGVAGSAAFNAGVFTVKGAGADMWGTADAFHFMYQPLNGDGQITARITGIQNTDAFAKVGVMIRETLTAGSAHALFDLRPTGDLEFMVRPSAAAETMFVAGGTSALPGWLRLTRTGSTFTASVSNDGTTWTAVSSTTVGMAANVFAGIAVTSHDTTVLNTATLDNVAVGSATPPPPPVSFSPNTIVVSGTTATSTAVAVPGFEGPTSLAIGPDGRLYASVVNGKIFIFTLDQTKLTQPDQAPVTHVQEIDDMYLKPSVVCDSNGENCRLQSGPGSGRQVTGIAIDPSSTPGNIILYVSNSGLGQTTTDMTLYTYGGAITRLTLKPDSGSTNDFVVAGNQDLVVGLPRSREAHSPNGMSIGPDGWLYLGIGGNTNAGQPSEFFANLPEYYLSAAVVRLNLANLLGKTLPIDVTNVRSASDLTPLQGTFELYATGYRNPYDIVWHRNGRLYLNGNAANMSQGNTPGAADGCQTPSISPGDQTDTLNIVTRGAYGGHPDPGRGECVWGDGAIYSPPLTPQANYVAPITNYVDGTSSDGIVEYTASAFSGQMKGNLISATWAGDHTVRRVVLNGDGSGVASVTALATFTQPLDVTTDANGIIYVADYGANELTLLVPMQLPACPIPGSDPKVTDSDSDGYTDYDEQANGTDPCSAASVPSDFNGNRVSDLLDTDDDSDGIADALDQLFFDTLNGANTALPVALEWNPSDPAYGHVANSGFTGVQISTNASKDEASGHAIIAAGIHPGDAGGHLTMWTYPGTAEGSANSQVNALQIGFDSTTDFRVWSSLTQPFTGVTPAAGHVGGIFFGPDQDNYIRLALVGTSGGGKALQLGLEIGAVFAEQARLDLSSTTVSTLDIFLVGSPASRTITAYYDVNASGTMTPLAAPVTVPAGWFSNNAGTAANTSLAGLMVSNGAAPQMAFVYDFFRIDRNVPPPPGAFPTSQPADPSPADGAAGVPTTTAVSWTPSANATSYDVAFGTTNPPPVVSTDQTSTTYQPAAPLAPGTIYYWQVTARGAAGTTAGPIWSFTTSAAAPTAEPAALPVIDRLR